MRFLFGTNGTDFDAGQTYRVSVSFGAASQVNITIVDTLRVVTAGPLDTWLPNTMALNAITSTSTTYPPIPEAPILKAAIEAGALELPFQFSYVVKT